VLRSNPAPRGGAHLGPVDVAMQRVGAFSGLPTLIAQLGADPASTLASARLAPAALDDPEGRVPFAALCRVLELAAARTSCAHIGLLAGKMWRLADLGIVGELVANCPTVRDALESLIVHQHLNSSGGLGFVLERGGIMDAGYAIYQAGLAQTDQFYDAVLAGTFNFLRELAGPAWLPAAIFVPHGRPRDVAPYRRLLKVLPRFDAEFCAIRFDARWLSHPVERSDAARRQSALARLDAPGRGEFRDQVTRAVRTVLLHGKHSGDDVAQLLSMHRRTLNRRLKAHGTTFQRVLDQVRFDVARHLLGQSNIPLDDVAATLGYAGVSPFLRTFRRWAGTTPGQWRRAASIARISERALTTTEGDPRGFDDDIEPPRAA
jgi:AraC-like DNA-binding protein